MKPVATSLVSCSKTEVVECPVRNPCWSEAGSKCLLTVVSIRASITFAAGQSIEIGRCEVPREVSLPGLGIGMTMADFQIAGFRHDVTELLLLLFAFRDLWKEWGDSNFQIFSQNCLFHHRRLESFEHFSVLLYIILSTTISFLEDTILFLQVSSFFHFVYIFIFCKYTLHVRYVFNIIDGFF